MDLRRDRKCTFPRQSLPRKVRDDEGVIASTRGRVRSPDCRDHSSPLRSIHLLDCTRWIRSPLDRKVSRRSRNPPDFIDNEFPLRYSCDMRLSGQKPSSFTRRWTQRPRVALHGLIGVNIVAFVAQLFLEAYQPGFVRTYLGL